MGLRKAYPVRVFKFGGTSVGTAEALRTAAGQRILAFDFDPIHRYLTLSDFRLVWNAILNWNDLQAAPPGSH